MNFIFWLCLVIDVILVALAAAGSSYRSGYGANIDFNTLAIILFVVAIVAAVWTRSGHFPGWVSLLLAFLPIGLMLALYLFEKITGTA